MDLVSAKLEDLAGAVDCLVPAFANDPLVLHFFPGEPGRRTGAAREFFTTLMVARVALNMPVIVLNDGEATIGAVMGYDTSRPTWPKAQMVKLDGLLRDWSGLSDRFDAYENLSKQFAPQEPHYYLGVLGVHPNRQGVGAGRTLITAYCRASDMDPVSSGTYLETASAENVAFYKRCGFDVTGSAAINTDVMLYCLFRPKQAAIS
jgi:ribosomal protein S18 acetylase RimI-like enzyme